MPATNRMLLTIMATLAAVLCNSAQAQPAGKKFEIVEATIADIQNAIKAKQLTATELVHMYLARIKAYNGTCVEEPQGILGPVSPIPHAGAVNALITLNLRPTARTTWGFDERKARSMTDGLDNDSAMPDALEVAAALDAQFARTGQPPIMPSRLTSPCDCDRPTPLFSRDGIRIEGPPSSEIAQVTRLAATEAAEPPLDPPGSRAVS